MQEVVAEFGGHAEYKLYSSVYQWDIVQKYGVIQPPMVIVNGAIRLTTINREELRQAIASQLQE